MKKLNKKSARPLPLFRRPAPEPYFNPLFKIFQSPLPLGQGDFWSKWFLTLLSCRIMIEYRGIKGKCVTDLHLWKKQMGRVDHIISNFLKAVFHKFYLLHSWILWPKWCWGKMVKLQRYWTYCQRLNHLSTMGYPQKVLGIEWGIDTNW